MTDAYFKTPFAIKTTTIFYMKKYFNRFLPTTCFLITRRHAGGATVNFHTLLNLNLKAMFLCIAGAALESLIVVVKLIP